MTDSSRSHQEETLTVDGETLDACPFCGERAIVLENYFDDPQVGCQTFGCRGMWKDGPIFSSRYEALVAWNQRRASYVASLAPSGEPEGVATDRMNQLCATLSRWSMQDRTDDGETPIDDYGKRILSMVIREVLP